MQIALYFCLFKGKRFHVYIPGKRFAHASISNAQTLSTLKSEVQNICEDVIVLRNQLSEPLQKILTLQKKVYAVICPARMGNAVIKQAYKKASMLIFGNIKIHTNDRTKFPVCVLIFGKKKRNTFDEFKLFSFPIDSIKSLK